MVVHTAENGVVWGWLGGTQGHGPCHHLIERIRSTSYLTLIETSAAILYRFRDIASYLSKVADFNLPHLSPAFGAPVGISLRSLASENESLGYCVLLFA